MAGLIYLLCAATALVCSAMLWRNYRKNRTQLLFWSCLCFLGLAAESGLLYLDVIAFPRIDLSMPRDLLGCAALSLLVYALIWDAE
jgi:hypothetical protein